MKRILIFVIKVSIILFSLWYLSKKIDFFRLPAVFHEISYNWLLVALLMQLASISVAAIRWKLVMDVLGFNEKSIFYQKLYFEGFFFSQALPGSVGGDAVRVLALKNNGYKLSDSIYGILVDRVSGLAGLLLISLMSIPYAPDFVSNSIVQAALIISTTGIIGFMAVVFVHKILPDGFALARLVNGVSRRFFMVYGSVRNASIQLILSIIVHALSILVVFFISISVGLGVDFSVFIFVMPLVFLVTILPVSFAGWGVREGAMVALFSMSGASQEAVLATSIVYGVVLIIASFPGLIALLASRNLT